jgi:hypothetical protein
MDAADERSMVVEATAAMLQEHAGQGCIDHTPRVSLLETSQQVLPRLWGKCSDRLHKVVCFDGKHRKLLVTAPVTTSMTGDLRWVTLANGLPKGVNACHQALVLLVGVRHRAPLLCTLCQFFDLRQMTNRCPMLYPHGGQ